VTIAPPDVGTFDEPDEVHVWAIRTDAARLDDLTPLLAADEVDRAIRFHFHRDRVRFIVRRAHLRRLLGAYLDQDPTAVRFTKTGTGKPVLAQPASDIHFSVSHSGDIGVCVVGRGHPVGIDVEQIRPGVEDALVSRVCTPNERAVLAAIPADARPAAFFVLWTHKEALVKADGRGLSLPVATIDVASALTDGNVATRLPGRGDDAAYTSCTISLRAAVAAAVAHRASTITVRSRTDAANTG
jgi:4'-phosphopantetheinyl transferase